MRITGTIAAIATAGLVAACSTTYFNPATGQTINAEGPTDNPDLTACRADYQQAVALGPALWMGEIVPACMKMRGWVKQ